MTLGGFLPAFGCDEEDQATSGRSEANASRFEVVLRKETGQIILPLDRFSASHRERGLIEYAGELLIRDCMNRAGRHYRVIDRRSARPEPSRRYGLWHRGSVRRHGYRAVDTPLSERFQANKMAPRPRGEAETLSSCFRRASRLSLPDPLPGDLAAFSLYGSMLKSDLAERVLEAWRSCLKEAGVVLPAGGDPWTPRSVLRDHGRHVATALVDLRCKRRVHLVTRLAGAEARLQRRWIAANQQTLDEQRDRITAMVAAAKRVIARLEP